MRSVPQLISNKSNGKGNPENGISKPMNNNEPYITKKTPRIKRKLLNIYVFVANTSSLP